MMRLRMRPLDTHKNLPIYMAKELSGTGHCSFINRADTLIPTGMEKEEELEIHFQRAMSSGAAIPTPEFINIEGSPYYSELYPPSFKMPRHFIQMQNREVHKNNERSYGTMLKLKRNFEGLLSHLETVKKRETSKLERLNLSFEGFEKRYKDEKGRPEAKASKKTAPAKKAAKGRASSGGRKSAPEKVEESDEDEDEEYEVEKVIDMRKRKGGREFLIKWKGYSKAKATWEPEDNLSCDDLVKEFEEKAQEKKDQPTRNLRADPKKTDRYVDTGDLKCMGRKRSSNRLGKYPRKTYREPEDD